MQRALYYFLRPPHRKIRDSRGRAWFLVRAKTGETELPEDLADKTLGCGDQFKGLLYWVVIIGLFMLAHAVYTMSVHSHFSWLNVMLGLVCTLVVAPVAALIHVGRWHPLKRVGDELLIAGFCPSCTYKLDGLQPDPADGCVVCPECSSAWRVPSGSPDAQNPITSSHDPDTNPSVRSSRYDF